ncbi:MAG: bifunctional oligoribonuclease/PAP phosphatase NrnA, partial [Clostridia bacterium]|nr:bifunctional oligoribonuclease/PAP phosphatase NrnA [Clostridia bacterium]
KQIYLANDDYSDYMAFLGGEDENREELYEDALLIVLDTATLDRISNKYISKAKELIKIDHHINVRPYGDICFVEDSRSSCCEMIADLAFSFRDELKVSSEAATYIYTGMVTDSGRFKFNSVSGETLRLAGMLLDKGIDTETLFANLYLDDFEMLQFRGNVYKKIKRTKNGVAYLYIDRKMQEKFSLTSEQASSLVSSMESIKGSLVWGAFIDNEDGSIRVRLRSRFLPINSIAEKYHGGGHECASGATVYSTAEMRQLLRDTDALLKKYKETHEGWL